MAWGRGAPSSGIDDLVKRLAANDPKLQSLTILRFRRFDESDAAALAKVLHANSTLQELNCSSHSITAGSSACLGSMLQHNRGLNSISVGNSSWGDEALAALAEGLRHNTHLEAWDLEHKGLTPQAAGSISEVLQVHPALQRLALSRNTLQDAGLARLCAAAWRHLQHLELADCGLTAQGVAALSAAASLSQLHHLDLSHNQLGPAAAEGLQQLVSAARQLRSLKLRNTGVGGPGVAALAKALPSHPTLQHLDLSCTQLDDVGLQALAAALAGSKQQLPLQQLLLGGNPDATDAAVSKLAQALAVDATGSGRSCGGSDTSSSAEADRKQQQQQWQLDLSETGVGAEAIESLSVVPGLQQLSLFGCNLGAPAAADGGAAISTLQACIANGGFADLQGLNLSGCNLNLDQLRSLMHQLAAGSSGSSGSNADGACPCLQTLEVGANPGVQQDGFEAMVQQLREARPGLDIHWRVADSDAPPSQEQAAA